MKSPLIDKSDRKRRKGRFEALPWVYLLTLAGFAVVATGLISAGRKFNVESVAIQKQIKTLSEQQILSER